MSEIQGSLVKLYLYKAEWTLAYSGTGSFKLRIGDTLSPTITDMAELADSLDSALGSVLGSGNYTITGSSSPFTITLASDYAFSGIGFSVEDAEAGVTVSVERLFPTSITSPTEGNGYYKMGGQTSLEKSYSNETQDVTDVDSYPYRKTVSQIKDITLTSSMFYLTEANYEALVKQYELLNQVILCDLDPSQSGGDQKQNFGVYTINNLTHSSNFNEVVAFNAEFALSGEPTAVTS